MWNNGAIPTTLTVHKYHGQVLAHEPNFDHDTRTKFGAPFVDLHRVDLQRALCTRAEQLGCKIHLNSRLESLDFDKPLLTTVTGKTFTGDLIVAADGLWSVCREQYLGRKDDPFPTGDLAYRIVLSIKDVEDDPELKSWIENPQVHFWIGPGAHAVAYSLRGGNMYNIVLLVPDNLPLGARKAAGDVGEMKSLFVGWDPILTRFLDRVNSIDKWKLMYREELPNWINHQNNLVMLGDCCHPMLPYLAQGANSSLEDGAVLGTLLGCMKTKRHLAPALKMYEQLRKARGEAIVKETFKQRHDFHMMDGPEQEARDKLFLRQLGKQVQSPFPSRWTDPETTAWLWGYDAIGEAERAVTEQPYS